MKVNHHPAKFCCHRYSGYGDIMVLVCPVIAQNHVTEMCSNIIGGSPSWWP